MNNFYYNKNHNIYIMLIIALSLSGQSFDSNNFFKKIINNNNNNNNNN